MMIKSVMSGVAAIALMSAPVAASASRAAAPAQIERVGSEGSETSDLVSGGWWYAYIGIAVVIIALLAATETWPFESDPVSP